MNSSLHSLLFGAGEYSIVVQSSSGFEKLMGNTYVVWKWDKY